MASSVAAMPRDSAPWRDPSSRPRPFFNVIIPPHRKTFSDATAPSSTPAEPTPRRRRIILERWAAAAAAVTAAETPPPADVRRRAREAELSELASATRPVAARAAVFREPSPAPSEASSCAGPDLPPSGPRASSLIQRWREIEAVGPATPRASGGDAASESDAGSPRGRVGCIVKKLSGAASLPEEDFDAANDDDLSLSQSAPSSPAPLRHAIQSLAVRVKGHHPPKLVVRTVRGRRAREELVARMAHRRKRELAALNDRHVVSRFAHKGRIQSMLRLKLLRQGDTINDEVWNLLRPVRPHPPRCGPEASAMRDDSSKKDLQEANECILQNNRVDEQQNDDISPSVEKSAGLSIENHVNSDCLRNRQYDEKINTEGCQEDCSNLVNSCVHNQEYSKASSFASYDNQRAVYDNQYMDDISPSTTTSTIRELQETPSSRGDTLREEDNQSLNGSWDERALWSSLGWPAPVDSMSPDSWHQDTIGDMENHNQIEFNDRPWIDSPNSWRSLHIATQAEGRDLSGNTDICNLLESKKVSKSLESDFSNKMNHLLRAILQKQRQQHMIDEFGGYYQEHLYWQQNHESRNEDHVTSAPCSLEPVSHVAAHPQESWQHSSFEHQHHENQNLLEMEVRVRSEMAQIHHEIYELRKLAESCIASQVKMQHSIKEEVCSALREAGLMRSQPDITAKKGTCCICNQMQVDSLLYRCGHMCTCFNCADQLRSSSGRCPICQSSIDDVVRAHPNF